MTDEEAKVVQKEMVDFGMAANMDEAAHMLVDAGEIDSTQHAELLSDAERERVYG